MAQIHRLIFIDPGATDIERRSNRLAFRLYVLSHVLLCCITVGLGYGVALAVLFALVVAGMDPAAWPSWALPALIVAVGIALEPVRKRVTNAIRPTVPRVEVLLFPSEWWVHDLRGQDAANAFELLEGIRYWHSALWRARRAAAKGNCYLLEGRAISEDEAAAVLDHMHRELQGLKTAA
jgi:hypothetical protein